MRYFFFACLSLSLICTLIWVARIGYFISLNVYFNFYSKDEFSIFFGFFTKFNSHLLIYRFRRTDERDEFGRRKWPEERVPIGMESVRGFNVRAQIVGPSVFILLLITLIGTGIVCKTYLDGD